MVTVPMFLLLVLENWLLHIEPEILLCGVWAAYSKGRLISFLITGPSIL